MSRFLLRAAAFAITTGLIALHADAAPKKPKKSDDGGGSATSAAASPEFDRHAAAAAIGEVSLQKCRATNATRGDGHVTITFVPGGQVEKASIDKGPWVGTPVARCMIKEFKKTKVPAFRGEPVTVGKSFHFE